MSPGSCPDISDNVPPTGSAWCCSGEPAVMCGRLSLLPMSTALDLVGEGIMEESIWNHRCTLCQHSFPLLQVFVVHGCLISCTSQYGALVSAQVVRLYLR